MAEDQYDLRAQPRFGGLKQLLGGKFGDTGRTPSSPGEYLDSYIGAPARTAINQAQLGNFNQEGLDKVIGSVGKDPMNAPTGQDIVKEAGIENPTAQKIAGIGMDMASSLPIPGLKSIPFAGQVQKVAPEAQFFDKVRAGTASTIHPVQTLQEKAAEKLKYVGPQSSTEAFGTKPSITRETTDEQRFKLLQALLGDD